MQYRTGTVAVANDSATVIGTNTAWTAGVAIGGMFLVEGDTVAYTVAQVVSDTEIRLSAAYQGAAAAGRHYWITTSFSPNRSYPVPEVGDVDSVLVVARAIQMIDADIPAGGAGARRLDDLLDVSASGVSTGQVLARLADGTFGFVDGGTGSLDGANLGAGGANLFAQKSGSTLQFRQLKAVGATVNQGTNDVTISVPAPGEINTGANLGTVGSVGLYKDKSGTALRFKALKPGSGVTVVEQGDDVVISATGGGAAGGEANTASNVGVGNVQVFRAKSGADLQFRSIQVDPARFAVALSADGLSYSIGLQPVSINDLGAAAASAAQVGQVLRKDSDSVWRGYTIPAAGIASVQADPAPRLGADLNANGKRILGLPGQVSGMIEAPRAKAYVISPRLAAPVSIVSIVAETRAGTVGFQVLANGTVAGAGSDGLGGLQGTASTTQVSVPLATALALAAGGRLELRLSSPSADAADVAFAIDYRSA